MSIVTKTGDDGSTSLCNGKRVRKWNVRPDCYGKIDELFSHLGMIRALLTESAYAGGKSAAPLVMPEETSGDILKLQERLVTLMGEIAGYPAENGVGDIDIQFLESRIYAMENLLPELDGFIIPGASVIDAEIHITRTVCREAERKTVRLCDEEKIELAYAVRYLNRLSDYLFTLGRILSPGYDRKRD